MHTPPREWTDAAAIRQEVVRLIDARAFILRTGTAGADQALRREAAVALTRLITALQARLDQSGNLRP